MKKKIETYKLNGYNTLIIWSSELKNNEQLKEKLISFNKGA